MFKPKVEIQGKNGIYAKILKDSVSRNSNQFGKRITSFEIAYPRIVHAEARTHRRVSMCEDEVMILSGQNSLMSDPMLSRNAASSRAIPFAKMQEQLTGMPVRFGQANPGMQDKGEDYTQPVQDFSRNGLFCPPQDAWEGTKILATQQAEAFYTAGYHKQIYNRLTEPFQMIKVVVTATEWNNFFWLRDHNAADPTIAELARCMKESMQASIPEPLDHGEWHLPYVESYRDGGGNLHYAIQDEEGKLEELVLNEAITVSGARCAAVSFRNIDYGLKKSSEVYSRLVEDDRKHGSALEHQATPMESQYDVCGDKDFINIPSIPRTWEKGITHMDANCNLWSGNFQGWIQNRQLIAGHTKEG